MFLPLLLLALLPVSYADSSFRLWHRLHHPSLPGAPFAHRGTLNIARSGPSATATVEHAQGLPDAFLDFAAAVQIEHLDEAQYQFALEHPGDTDSSQWDVSSVNACHLPGSTSETIAVHLASDGTPFALDYFLSPIPHDGACPKRKSRKSDTVAQLKPVTNTTVLLRTPRLPPLPQLRVPPPLTPEGKVAEPAEEKNFLQKYWMYILIGLAALILSPAAPEEEGGQQQQQGGGRR